MKNKEPNQLHRELLGVAGLNPWVGHDSSSRVQMFGSHISQTLVINGATERRTQTGLDREYGKYTFSVKVPGDPNNNDGIQVIKVIERYPAKYGIDAIKLNPQIVVIYEDINTKEIGMLNLPNFCTNHPYFGFEYKKTPDFFELKKDAFLPAGTVLLDSPSVTEDGGYKFGIEANIAFMSHPSVSEDGVMVSDEFLKKLSFKTFETRVVEWGNKRFALNLYGDENNFKPFPDIGDRIRDDGILMALRTYDPALAVVEQNIHSVMEPDFIFDKLTYAGGPGGKVVDIRIQRNVSNIQSDIPQYMDTQAEKYDSARRIYYQEILNVYHRLKGIRGDSLRLTPELHRLIVEALAVLDNDHQKLVRLYRSAPLDDYRVEFVIEYEITPTVGFKISDENGG